MKLSRIVQIRQAYDLSVSLPPVSPLSLHEDLPLTVTSPGESQTPRVWRSWTLVLEEKDRCLVVDPSQRYLVLQRRPEGNWYDYTSRKMLGSIGRENALREFGKR